MADGGEGTVDILIEASNGEIVVVGSVDANNRPIQSYYGILGDKKTAVIEMAAASGIELLSPEERNPLVTSTFGTGLLIKSVLEAGFTNILIGIGGSSTNDGGAGMAQALGFGLLDENGNQIGSGGGFLNKLQKIDQSNVHPLLRRAKITIAGDVRNLLLGPSGASCIYAPQKGATPEMVEILETNMVHFSEVLENEFGIDYAHIPGAGAAGGLGAGLLAFCHAEMKSGFEIIGECAQLEEKVSKADLVITGEGRIDSQTSQGKVVGGIAKLGKKYQVPVIVLTGDVNCNLEDLYSLGVTSVFPIANRPMSVHESKANASELLSDAAERISRILIPWVGTSCNTD